MFCMKCGKPTEDGQVICPECAAAAQPVQEQPVEIPVEEPVFQAPVEEPVFQAPVFEAPAEAPVFEAPVQEPAAPAEALFDLNLSSELPAEGKKKKVKAANPKKKKLITWIVSGVVALSIVAVGLLGFLVWDWGDWVQNIFWSMKPAEEYKNNVEQKALTDEDANNETALLKKGLTSVYGAFVSYAGPQDGAAEMKLDVELGKELITLLEIAAGGQLPDGMEIPSNASLTIGSNASGDSTQVDMGLALNNVELLKLRYIVDMAKEMGYLGILSPDKMSDEYLSMDLSELMAELSDSAALVTLMTDFAADLPSEEDFAEMLDRYILLVVEQIQEVDKENETVEADGVKQSFTVLTYEISQETLKDIVIAVLEEAEDDETLYQLVQAFCNLANEVSAMEAASYDDDYYDYYEPAYYDPDEIFDQIPDLIEEMEDVDADDEALFEINTYVDNKGNICGRKLTVEDADVEIFYITTVSGNKVGFLAEMDIDGQTASLEGSGKTKKDQVTGTITVEVEKQEMLVVELDAFDIKAYTGTIHLKLGDDAKDMLEESMNSSMGIAGLLDIANIAIELNLGTESVGIGLAVDGNKLIGLNLSAVMKDASKVSLPKDTVSIEDETALEQWLSNLDMDKLADQLEKAGLPDEIVDSVREADPSEMGFGSKQAESTFDDYDEEDIYYSF